MEINQDTLEKLKQLDRAQLQTAIGQLADALGASPAQKRMALNHAGLIRRKLSGMSAAELQKHLAGLDPDQRQALAKTLKL
jgi:hypothetical protein